MKKKQFRQLVIWSQFTAPLLILFFCVVWCVRFLYLTQKELRLEWDKGVVLCSPINDGPYVVTHLMTGSDKANRAVAVLPKPLEIVDSAGVRIDAEQLVWRSASTGEQVPTPPVGTPIKALYFPATTSKESTVYAQ